MSFIDDFEDDEKKSSHEQVKPKSNTKLKPRFSINLSDEDFAMVKSYCESRSISPSVLSRLVLLDKVKA